MRISDWSSDVCSSDLSSIRVYDTPVGPLGTLACGENTNTLARFALLSQGELVHVANYIALPVAPASYNMAEAIKIRATAHSFEGKVFTIVACSAVKIGRASCRERGVQYGEISVVAVTFKKKK